MTTQAKIASIVAAWPEGNSLENSRPRCVIVNRLVKIRAKASFVAELALTLERRRTGDGWCFLGMVEEAERQKEKR